MYYVSFLKRVFQCCSHARFHLYKFTSPSPEFQIMSNHHHFIHWVEFFLTLPTLLELAAKNDWWSSPCRGTRASVQLCNNMSPRLNSVFVQKIPLDSSHSFFNPVWAFFISLFLCWFFNYCLLISRFEVVSADILHLNSKLVNLSP